MATVCVSSLNLEYCRPDHHTIAKYSSRGAMIMGNNSVPALATLFLLFYAKLVRTIITVLSYTMLYTTHGQKAVWSADGNFDY